MDVSHVVDTRDMFYDSPIEGREPDWYEKQSTEQYIKRAGLKSSSSCVITATEVTELLS